jgi:hypothetical protein
MLTPKSASCNIAAGLQLFQWLFRPSLQGRDPLVASGGTTPPQTALAAVGTACHSAKIRNPKSAIQNPQSKIINHQSSIRNHQSAIADAMGFRLHPSGVQCE